MGVDRRSIVYYKFVFHEIDTYGKEKGEMFESVIAGINLFFINCEREEVMEDGE